MTQKVTEFGKRIQGKGNRRKRKVQGHGKYRTQAIVNCGRGGDSKKQAGKQSIYRI